jgi:valyl-tRNA synthetase
MKSSLEKGYEPGAVEKKLYEKWLAEGLFHATEGSGREPFSIVIPPPNVTGSLHMGHALNNTLQDILSRWKRMKGFEVLWMPGTDHAGIATQNVVERELAGEGLSRDSLGREAFIERVWEWKKIYGHKIIQQLQRLGSSCDWERERFTMDDGLSRAVREVFVRLYEEDLIYRGFYIINWCPRCRTALSDLEAEHAEVEGHLYYVRYPLEGREDYIEVATTRPETILGDTAVAYNPGDDRYRKFQGGAVRAVLPVLKRIIPVIADDFVQKEFGTGAVKITPAHDPHDYEVSLRHDLPVVKVIGENGRMTGEAGPFAGLDRFEARKRIVETLDEEGLLFKIDEYRHAVGHCYRCKTIVEPYLSRQWFVRIKPLAEPAIRAVEEKAIRIVPEQWEKTYFEWMRNIRDWCISRQIWWGHRIPAWYCDSCGEVIVSREEVASCTACGHGRLTQDSDVLDTWFSSALWPFSTMGWPEKTPALDDFYPTSVLVTAFDILFFWVARMIMMGLKFMEDVPFKEVYIHALVRDAEGQKMSKSKGNVIDPLEIMDRYGTDAFRFSLASFAVQGRDVKLSTERIEGYRHFANKIWNASRFVLMNLEDDQTVSDPDFDGGETADRWIAGRLAEVSGSVNEAFREYRFNDAAGILYQFVWHEFCDWYLELSKIRLYGSDQEKAGEIRLWLIFVLDAVLKMLHPIMPFITEEIWQKLPGSSGSLMKADYPLPENFANFREPESHDAMALIMESVRALRNIRSEMNIPPSIGIKAILKPVDSDTAEILTEHTGYITHLAGVESLEVNSGSPRPRGSAAAVTPAVEAFVPLGGLLDLSLEKERLARNLSRLEKDLSFLEKKLGNRNFVERAPAELVSEERERKEELEQHRERLLNNLGAVEEAMG